ncbi:MAG TPA: TadE/TadG family type IV pilus assembly protein [Tepidisphaeraceae bacterium]|nr:TadE/TadG family type IV pilus assembly protein [Tepidisphaeraceae bacterium]
MHKTHIPRRWRTGRAGSAILEMSLIAPLLFMLSFGVADYGYFLYVKNTFQGAAQAGARAAVPYAATNANVTGTTGIVTKMMTAAGVPSANYTVTLSPSNISGISAGTLITVTLSANWSTVGTHILPASMGGLGSSKVVSATAIAQKESN